MADEFERKGAPPDYLGAGLRAWTLRVGSVDSFGGMFLFGSYLTNHALMCNFRG